METSDGADSSDVFPIYRIDYVSTTILMYKSYQHQPINIDIIIKQNRWVYNSVSDTRLAQ